MRLAIISDIHSNVHALKSAIDIIDSLNIDVIACLGDIVGYNAFPNECIDIVRKDKRFKYIISGNHDIESATWDEFGDIYCESLSTSAIEGLQYTNEVLTVDNRKWLKSLKKFLKVEIDGRDILFTHSSDVFSSNSLGYIIGSYEAYEFYDKLIQLDVIKHNGIVFFGHTHAPTKCIVKSDGTRKFQYGSEVVKHKVVTKSLSSSFLLNPGSIGQARINHITSFIVYDTEKMNIQFITFDYDWESAAKAIYDRGYSITNANRLRRNKYDD